jgi:hypothetical protein
MSNLLKLIKHLNEQDAKSNIITQLNNAGFDQGQQTIWSDVYKIAHNITVDDLCIVIKHYSRLNLTMLEQVPKTVLNDVKFLQCVIDNKINQIEILFMIDDINWPNNLLSQIFSSPKFIDSISKDRYNDHVRTMFSGNNLMINKWIRFRNNYNGNK